MLTSWDELNSLCAQVSEVDVEALRGQLEDSMKNWTHADTSDHEAVSGCSCCFSLSVVFVVQHKDRQGVHVFFLLFIIRLHACIHIFIQ